MPLAHHQPAAAVRRSTGTARRLRKSRDTADVRRSEPLLDQDGTDIAAVSLRHSKFATVKVRFSSLNI